MPALVVFLQSRGWELPLTLLRRRGRQGGSEQENPGCRDTGTPGAECTGELST